MKKTILFVFVLMLGFAGWAQGHETFDNLDEPASSYKTGTFTGENGVVWNYVQARGDSDAEIEEGDKAIMLGRNRTPDSELNSESIPNGIGTLKFTYMQAFGSNTNMEVYVNETLVYTATSEGPQGETIETEEITVNIDGDFTFRFYNPSGAGQINIDDIIWTATGDEPTLNITSPNNEQQFAPGITPDITFNLTNFDISSDADAADGDGYVQYQINEDDFENHFSTEAIDLGDLEAGEYEVTLRLVDNDGEAIEGLSDSVTFTLNAYTEVATIAELRDGEINGYYTLTGEAVLTYQQAFRNQKYIQDETAAILIDDQPGVITTTYDQYDGITGITGKLNVNNGIMQFQPALNTEEATSTDNSIVPVIITITDLMENPGTYESQIIAIENIEFVLEDGEIDFETGHNYTVRDEDDNTTIMRTNFFDADYIGEAIPTGIQDVMVGIAARFHDDGQFFIRDTNDLEGGPMSTDSFDKTSISLYPNPAADFVNLQIEGKAQVQIYSLTGKQVKEFMMNDTERISISDLNAGIYLVKINQNGNTVTKKLIVQ